ncbi:glycosyltransferase family 39 protein [Amycolatopsis magusensis]|uniref:Glycosyltransferase RgtA/B/C/D-like domain-containing protein n=1 Tax=Amycolatopsis magusensis TaxID=882444 RepID=A0ABS4PJM3_9PSEU|nr:glycosyltransferase family 39 protein [Amycolatopsis magusensis]MBP2179626.1 hypothetical protein [Amycolatopsis magusensis]
MTESGGPGSGPGPAQPAGAARLRAFGAVCAGTALVAVHGLLYGNWLVDDAAITFAYARDVADGAGPVLQPGGDSVEGFSNPAWLLLLVLGKLLRLFDSGTILGVPDYVLFPKLLGLLCTAGVLAAWHHAAKGFSRRPALLTLGAGAVLAVIPSYVLWTVSGLENSLYALAVCWLAAITLRALARNDLSRTGIGVQAGLLAALAALTRPDGALYVIAYPLVLLVFVRRHRLPNALTAGVASLVAFAVPYGGYLGWRYLEFGRLVPNTAIAKGQDFPSLETFALAGDLLAYAGAWLSLLLAAGVGVLLAKGSPRRDALSVLLLFLGLSAVVFCVLGPEPNGELRFATPFWAIGALLLVFVLGEALAFARGIRRLAVIGVVVLASLPTFAAFADSARRHAEAPIVPACLVAERYGRVFNGYADVLGVREGTLLVPDVGGTALTSRLRVVDLVGLTHARIAELAGSGDHAGLRDYLFDEVKPTFVHTHQPWSEISGITADPRLDRDYHPLFEGGPKGDWVRKDAVPSMAKLQEVRDYAEVVTHRVLAERAGSLRGSCGAVLRPGQTP